MMRELVRCAVLAIFLFGASGHSQSGDNGSTITSPTDGDKAAQTSMPSKSTNAAITPTFGNGTCPSRTANYITHTLPQQCLRTDRSSSATNSTATEDVKIGSTTSSSISTTTLTVSEAIEEQEITGSHSSTFQESTGVSDSQSAVSSSSPTPEAATANEDESGSPLDNANFLSFEEWKKQNQPKADADRARNQPLADRQRPINNALESFGDEGEIDLDFAGFGGGDSPRNGPSQPRGAYRQADGSAANQDVPTSQTKPSKDAGKTCKERTNYASFDCAAQVMKNNPECKSVSSILVENKDSYMLNTCSAQNKFLIVELCNDVLVDTIVLANYEFFSSSFRHFRVSVSDRYPVKMEKWRELGTFEARNTREIQAFLVEHPQIWARYLRVEFLSHYGSEYYCPVSLLRVHGKNMLEDLRPQDDAGHGEGGEEEAALEVVPEATIVIPPEPKIPTEEPVKETTSEISNGSSSTETAASAASSSSAQITSSETSTSSPVPTFGPDQNSTRTPPVEGPALQEMTCSSNDPSATSDTSTVAKGPPSTVTEQQPSTKTAASPPNSSSVIATSSNPSSSASSSIASSTAIASGNNNHTAERTIDSARQNVTSVENTARDEATTLVQTADMNSSAVDTNVSPPSSATNTTRTALSSTATQLSQPQPSTQESFFKSISKRLQQLESNSTLSLQYIEEQSRILRDAFSKVEKRQITTTSNFLTNLNETVMKELHGFRQAYDQLWQSTVLELEGQREQYQREMLAMSSRLTLVADELVWQKRMGIVQSTLLLLCLGLVLFARTGVQGYFEVPIMQQVMNKSSAALSRAGWESPPASPSPGSRSPVALFRRKLWRATTEPGVVGSREGTDGDVTGTDSRPETRDGPGVDVFVEPPTPPPSRGTESGPAAVYDDMDADDEDESHDLRGSQSGPSTPTGTRRISDGALELVNGVTEGGVG